MAVWGDVVNGRVVNAFQAPSLEVAKLVAKGEPTSNFVGIGSVWSEEHQRFMPPQPYPSWTWDEATAQWTAPEPRPENGEHYWDEESLSWIELEVAEDTPAEAE